MSLAELEKFRADINKCFRCNLCKIVPLPFIRDTRFVDNCPIASHYHFHAYSGSGLQFLAHSLIDGRLPASAEMADIAFACRSCGYCDVACKSIMDAERTQVIQALREHLTEEGFAPESNRRAMEAFRSSGYIEGTSSGPSELVQWARSTGIKILPEQKADVLLYVGSELRADVRYLGVVQRLAKLLMAAQVDFGILGAEPCSGIHAYWMASRSDLMAAAGRVTAAVKGAGARTVVTASGTSLGMLRAKYPDYGVGLGDVPVQHATEYLSELLQAKKLRLPRAIRATVTYHDPCFLGRQSEPTAPWQGETCVALGQLRYEVPPKTIRYGTRGVYDAPRQILGAIAGLTLAEMPRIREYALCCGYGGGANQEQAALTGATGSERLREAQSVSADILATACGFCEMHLRSCQGAEPNPAMRVLDVIDLVYEAAALE